MTEVWAPCVSAPSYEVSSLGRVRRIKPYNNTKVGLVLKQFVFTGSGYLGVCLSHEGVRKTYAVHRLVCGAFHGPRPSPKHHAAHRNDIASDNREENLRWLLHLDNMRERDTPRGSECAHAKLTVDDVQEIRALLFANQYSHAEIARRFGVTTRAIWLIKNGRSWGHLPSPVFETGPLQPIEMVQSERELVNYICGRFDVYFPGAKLQAREFLYADYRISRRKVDLLIREGLFDIPS